MMQHTFLGIGATKGFDGQGSVAFIKAIMKQHDIRAFKALGSLEKAVQPAFLFDLEKAFQAPLHLFSAQELEKQTPYLKNPSKHVFEAVGCHSVAEAAALALIDNMNNVSKIGAFKIGELIVEKTSFAKMTIAISRVVIA